MIFSSSVDGRIGTCATKWYCKPTVDAFALLCFVRARLVFTTDFFMNCKWQMAIGLHTDIHKNLQGANVRVKVEVRQSAAAPFGRGTTQLMPFRQFLRRFAAGDSSMYMTAQVRMLGCCHWTVLLNPIRPSSAAMLFGSPPAS